MKYINIFLSGSIKKGRSDGREEDCFWTLQDESLITEKINGPVVLLNPAKSDIKRNDYFVNYGCDLHLVQNADVVIADLRTKKGIGVGAELMYAQFIGKPVIGWLPENSYYRRDRVEDVFGEDLVNWIHPFAYGLCDFIVNSLEEAADIIKRMSQTDSFKKNSQKSPAQAIEYFREKYGETFGSKRT